MSLYANYSHALGRTGLYYGMHRIQNGTDYLSPTDDEDRRRTVTGNVGVEYRPSEHHTLGARVDVNTLFGPGRTRTTTTVRDAATLDVESLLRASNDYYRQKGNRYGGTLFYTYAPAPRASTMRSTSTTPSSTEAPAACSPTVTKTRRASSFPMTSIAR